MGVFSDTMEKNKRDIQQEVEKVNKSIENQTKQNNERITKQEQKQALRGVLYQYLYNYFQDNIISWIIDPNIDNIHKDLKKLKTMNKITAELGENACEREYLLSIYDRELKKVYNLILKEKTERWDELTERERNYAYKQNMQISMERMRQGFENIHKMQKEFEDEAPKEDTDNWFIVFLVLAFAVALAFFVIYIVETYPVEILYWGLFGFIVFIFISPIILFFMALFK